MSTEIMPGVVVGAEVLGVNATHLNNRLENTSTIKGLETFSLDSQAYMAPPVPMIVSGQKKVELPIIMMNPATKVAAIYLNATTDLSNPQYVTPLCVFLDSATEDSTIKMYLGSAVDDVHAIGISSIIYSMQHCKAKIETYAYGMCSIPESMIWSYGQTRFVGDYGCVRFGGGEWIRRMEKAFKPYIATYLNHCKKLGLLNDEQIATIVDKQKEYMLMKDIDTQELTTV